MTSSPFLYVQDKLSTRMEIAVKQLFLKNQQDIDEFLNELVLITNIKL